MTSRARRLWVVYKDRTVKDEKSTELKTLDYFYYDIIGTTLIADGLIVIVAYKLLNITVSLTRF